jgi:hypothetical protein
MQSGFPDREINQMICREIRIIGMIVVNDYSKG